MYDNRTTMHKSSHIRECLNRFKVTSGLSWKDIAEAAGLSQSTVTRYVKQVDEAQGPSYETISSLLDAHPDLAASVDGLSRTTRFPIYGYVSFKPKYQILPPGFSQDRYAGASGSQLHSPTSMVVVTAETNPSGFGGYRWFFQTDRAMKLDSMPVNKVAETIGTSVPFSTILCVVSHKSGQPYFGHLGRAADRFKLFGLSSINLQKDARIRVQLPEDQQPLIFEKDDIVQAFPIYCCISPTAMDSGQLEYEEV